MRSFFWVFWLLSFALPAWADHDFDATCADISSQGSHWCEIRADGGYFWIQRGWWSDAKYTPADPANYSGLFALAEPESVSCAMDHSCAAPPPPPPPPPAADCTLPDYARNRWLCGERQLSIEYENIGATLLHVAVPLLPDNSTPKRANGIIRLGPCGSDPLPSRVSHVDCQGGEECNDTLTAVVPPEACFTVSVFNGTPEGWYESP